MRKVGMIICTKSQSSIMASSVLLLVTIRPTSLDFLLARADPSLLLRAAEICSVLWGGVYHPIVILDHANRTLVGEQERWRRPIEQEILGTLKDFDPDFVVTIGGDTLPGFL